MVVADEIAWIQKKPPVGLLSLGMAVTLWLASSLLRTLIDTLNRIQGVPETRPFWKLALTSVFLTILEALIILGTLGFLVIWPQLRGLLRFSDQSVTPAPFAHWLTLASGILISFSVISYLGPNIRRRWKWVTPGSVLGTFALLAACLLLQLYIQFFGSYGKTYGSLAGVMLLSFWFWITAVILLVAFQLDKVLEDQQEKCID